MTSAKMGQPKLARGDLSDWQIIRKKLTDGSIFG